MRAREVTAVPGIASATMSGSSLAVSVYASDAGREKKGEDEKKKKRAPMHRDTENVEAAQRVTNSSVKAPNKPIFVFFSFWTA
jgi:hypothetical protein